MKAVTTQPQDLSPMKARLSHQRIAASLAVLAIAGVAATMAVSPAIAAAHEPPDESPFRLKVSSHGKSVNASPGSFCDGDFCSDSFSPLKTRGRLPIHPGGRIALRLDSPGRPDLRASRVSVRIVRYKGYDRQYISESREARPTDSSRRVWVVEMPHRLHGARVLSVFLQYPDGDAFFEAAFKPHAASVHPVAKSCRPVAFTPNSDDMAAGIRARGVGCAFARGFIRGYDAVGGERYRGYSCTYKSVETPVSVGAQIRCTRGTRVISWKRY